MENEKLLFDSFIIIPLLVSMTEQQNQQNSLPIWQFIMFSDKEERYLCGKNCSKTQILSISDLVMHIF